MVRKLLCLAVSLLALATVVGAQTAPVRILASTTSYTDSQANVWQSDASFISGNTNTTKVSNTITGALPGSTDQTLYQVERFGKTFTVTIPFANGTANVTMKLAETYWTAAGKRIFSCTGNGVAWLTNFDIFATVGQNKALDENFSAIITNGQLVISCTASVDNAKIDSIQVVPAVVPPIPPIMTCQCSTAVAPHSVNLNWQASVSAGVAGYRVYRTITPTGTPLPIGTTSSLQYLDTSVSPGATYYYSVTAFNAAGLESIQSNVVPAIIPNP